MLTVLFTAPKSRPAHLAPMIFTFPDRRGMDDIAKRKQSSVRLTNHDKQRQVAHLKPCFNVRSGVVWYEHRRPLQKCRKPIRRTPRWRRRDAEIHGPQL